MTVAAIAFVLLMMRLVTVGFALAVVLKQLALARLNIDSSLTHFRWSFLALGVVFLVGNALPILTDVNYAFLHISEDLNILVWYAVSNASMSLAASVLLWNVYRIAGRQIEAERKTGEA